MCTYTYYITGLATGLCVSELKSTYTIWGRKDCPNIQGTKQIYHGYAAGTPYHTRGGGSNYICLTSKPRFLSYQKGVNGWVQIGPVEYEPTNNYDGTLQHNAPCAVCGTIRSKSLMIPGTYACPSGWKREYYGYLRATRYNHAGRAEFVCVHHAPQLLPGSTKHTHNAAEWWNVEPYCEVLPCPPYNRAKKCMSGV